MIKQGLKKCFLVGSGIAILALVIDAAVWAENSGKGRIVSAEEKREMLNVAKNELNNTVWQIELKQTAIGKKKKSEKGEADVLRFKNNKIISDKLASSGFSSSNYTVRLKRKDKDIVIWETMQASEEKGVAFWRGEIRNGIMRGVLSWHVDEKNKKNYLFVSTEKEDVSEEAIEAVVQEIKKTKKPAVQKKETPAPVAEVKTEDVEKEEKSKKKKGWLW